MPWNICFPTQVTFLHYFFLRRRTISGRKMLSGVGKKWRDVTSHRSFLHTCSYWLSRLTFCSRTLPEPLPNGVEAEVYYYLKHFYNIFPLSFLPSKTYTTKKQEGLRKHLQKSNVLAKKHIEVSFNVKHWQKALGRLRISSYGKHQGQCRWFTWYNSVYLFRNVKGSAGASRKMQRGDKKCCVVFIHNSFSEVT